MKILTNASKRDKDHMVNISADMVLNYIIPRFGYMRGKKFKYIKIPGMQMTLHYNTSSDGEIELGFEEPHNGIAETWYRKEILAKAAKHEKLTGHPTTVTEEGYSI